MVSSLASQLRSTPLGPQPPGWGPFFIPENQTAQPRPRHGVLVFVAQAAAPTGRTPRVSRLALRSHYWGVLVVVVAAGDLNTEGADLLASYLRRVQLDNDVVVDLWDVTLCDPDGIATLEAAKARADEAGWGFAVVADPDGAVRRGARGQRCLGHRDVRGQARRPRGAAALGRCLVRTRRTARRLRVRAPTGPPMRRAAARGVPRSGGTRGRAAGHRRAARSLQRALRAHRLAPGVRRSMQGRCAR